MLRTLEVDGLAVLERVSVDFGPGLNVLSGETGAGKSLILDALRLALGARADPGLVRPGRERARVAALFAVATDGATARLLAEAGVEPEDGQVLLAREIGADGRTVCRVNGRLATLGQLRQAGACLVTVVGQGEHHRFASPAAQLDFLDAYGGPELLRLRSQVRAAHAAWEQARQAVRALGGDAAQRRARLDLLAEQVQEIDAVGPVPDEEEHLAARRQVMAHAERLLGGVQRALEVMREGDEAVGDRLGAVRRDLGVLARLDPGLREAGQLVEQALIALDEACRALSAQRERLRMPPGEVQALEERWTALQRLKRRYGGSLAAVLQERARAVAEMQALEESERRAGALTGELEARAVALGRLAERLGALRAEAAARLQAEVAAELRALGMPGAAFEVALEREDDAGGATPSSGAAAIQAGGGSEAGAGRSGPASPTVEGGLGDAARVEGAAHVPVDGERVRCRPDGAERVTFRWSANPGLPALPLQRAASGGELARLLLALHALRAAELEVPTLVFDEVDAGIGGRAAAAVAERLQRLGAERQVLCVTHLAVIAAAADRHFTVDKGGDGAPAAAVVRLLHGEQRTAEVARMLDGGRGQTSRAHALEILQRLRRPAG